MVWIMGVVLPTVRKGSYKIGNALTHFKYELGLSKLTHSFKYRDTENSVCMILYDCVSVCEIH
jgi:hypothetical protein